MAERSPVLLCILPTKSTSFVFATHCLLIFLHPCVRFCMLKALSTYISKTAVNAQSSSGLSASIILQRVSMSKWTVRLGRWKKRWKHSSRSQLVGGVDRGLKGVVGEVVCIGVTLAIAKFGRGDLIIDGHWRMNAPNIT